MYSPNIRDDLIPLLYRLARQEGKPMTRLVDEILRAEIERRYRGSDTPTESLKKTPDERGIEELLGREEISFGLRPSVLHSPLEQHTDPDSEWKIVMS
jgi:hypothetical protein